MAEYKSKDNLNDLLNELNAAKSAYETEVEMQETLLQLQISNAERLRRKRQADNEKLYKDMLALGFKSEDIINQERHKQRLEDLKKEQEAQIAAINASSNSDDVKKQKIEEINLEFKLRTEKEKKLAEDISKAKTKLQEKQYKAQVQQARDTAKAMLPEPTSLSFFSKELTDEIKTALADSGLSEEEIDKAIKSARLSAGADYADKLAKTGADIASAQTEIDTRLQGLQTMDTTLGMGSYWRTMNMNFGANIGLSPFVKQQTMVEKLKSMVSEGIAFNVEQRAFLATISEKIATTFEAADGTLLKLIRIQQADTTAARLGMESALTAFLNSMYETSEYMTNAAKDIRADLYEASALRSAVEATELEYTTQKWIGSLYSVGFSSTSNISKVFGQLAAGDISAITDGGVGNLLIMAADAAGLALQDLLSEGITDTEANKLFKSMVEYLSKLYDETKDSKVVAQQIANVYGLTASDLKAASNLLPSVSVVGKASKEYSDMLDRLTSMSATMHERTSVAGMMSNLMDNFSYTMAEGLGNNPILYATYQIADMLSDVGGAGNLPAILAAGFGVNLNSDIANLMKIGAMSGSILQGIGKLTASLATGGGFYGPGMLRAFGISGGNPLETQRGSAAGQSSLIRGSSTSFSGFIGNASDADVKNKTINDASEDAEAQLAEAKAEEDDIKLHQVDEHIIDIYDLLLDVVSGSRQFRVVLGDAPTTWSA